MAYFGGADADQEGFKSAAEAGEVSKVRDFLNRPKNIEAEFQRTSDFRVVALHKAAEKNRVEVVRTILQLCPKVLVHDEDDLRRTVLHVAALSGNTAIVTLLKDKNVNVNARAKGKITALHLAAFKGHEEVVQQLLTWKVQVDLDACSSENFTALHMAADAGHENIVRSLVAAYRERDAENLSSFVNAEDCFKRTPLHYACRKGHHGAVKVLLSVPQISVNAVDSVYKLRPLHLAAWQGNYVRVVKALLAHDSTEVNAKIGHHDCVLPTDVQLKGKTSWELLPRPTLADREGSDWPQFPKGGTALHLAAHENHVGVALKLLASSKTDLNAVDVDGKTALHMAVEKAHLDIATKLVEHERTEVNLLDRSNKSALQYAVALGHEHEFAVLVAEPRVNLNLESNSDTALTLAFKLDRRAMVKALLAHPRLRANTKNWRKNKTMVHYLWDKSEELKEDFHLDCSELLMRREDVQRYMQGLSKEKRSFQNSTNAFLVGAAIVTAVSFAGFLKPPLPLTTDASDRLKYSTWTRSPTFWVLNIIALFFAIYSLISGMKTVLPKGRRFLEDEVLRLRYNVGVTSFTLVVSSGFVIAAFIAAVLANLPPDEWPTTVASTIFLLLLVPFIFIPLIVDYDSYSGGYSSAHVQKQLASLSDRLFDSGL